MFGFLHTKKAKRITNATIAGLFVAVQLPLSLLLGSTAAALTRTFTPGMYDNAAKVDICHRTSADENADNPYNDISVSVNATDGGLGNGANDHTGHDGDVWYPGHSKDPGWGDIIPPYSWSATEHPSREAGSYPGKNWTTAGQAIWENGCEAPEETTEVTPEAVTFDDQCGTENDSYTIPESQEGVEYRVGSTVQTPGEHPYLNSDELTVNAYPTSDDYTLTGTQEWSNTFTDEECESAETGSLTIVKDAIPNDETDYSNQQFGFTVNPGDSTFNLKDDNKGNNTESMTDLALDQEYTVTEDETDDWALTDISCGDADVTVNLETRSVKVTLSDSENQKDVTCTFTNTEDVGPQVTICHARAFGNPEGEGEGSGPYIKISPNAAGVYHGHLNQHTGPVYPATGEDGKWGDIIPPFEYKGETYSYNWDEEGQLIFRNDCEVGGQGSDETGSISGAKFNDLNGNSTWDQNEPGLSGWTIFLDANSNGTLDNGEDSTTTASDGTYSFTDLDEGTYKVCEVQQTGWTQKKGGTENGCYSLSVSAEGTLNWEDINFGNMLLGGQGSVLGESTTAELANTGSPLLVNLFAGLAIWPTSARILGSARERVKGGCLHFGLKIRPKSLLGF